MSTGHGEGINWNLFSVEIPYTVHGAYSFTSEVNELGLSGMNKH